MSNAELELYAQSVVIDAPVERVSACFEDVERWSTWSSLISSSGRVTEGGWHTGFELKFYVLHMPLPVHVKVIAYEPGRRIAWGERGPDGALVHEFEFEPLKVKRCRVHQREYATGNRFLLGVLLKLPIMVFDRQFLLDLKHHMTERGKV